MILAYLLLITGLTISSVAIYYSVAGLTAIFSAAAVPIMIMGVSLEVAKLVCATWIKQYWTQVPRLMKTYMLMAITLLMFITSMGIFGFLSKAHNDQNLVSGDVLSRISIYDEKIKTAKENIEANRRALKQMDEAVDQSMARSTTEQGADKAVAIRRGQAKERGRLQAEIAAEQKAIAALNEQAAPIRAEIRKVDAEVGPIKYIAAFLYGVEPDASLLEKAVTWIIILIVVVFDPLAVIMLLAAQMTFGWLRGVRPVATEKTTPGFVDSIRNRFKRKENPTYTADNTELTQQQLDQINAMAADYAEKPEPDYTDYSEGALVPIQDPAPAHIPGPEPKEESPVAQKKSLWGGFGFPMSSVFVSKFDVESNPVEPVTNTMSMDERPGDYVEPPVDNRPREAAPGRNRGVMTPTPVQADNAPKLGKASNTGFGNAFPATPEKGDVYLRTDFLPNRLFKFNGNKWIEVDKNSTDVYAYEEQYIKHLIEQIDLGKYDTESLSDVEREQIRQYLGRNEQ